MTPRPVATYSKYRQLLKQPNFSPEVRLRVSLDDFEGGDLSVAALVGVGDAHDGVDVGVGELHHLGKVLHVHHGVVQVDLKGKIREC